MTKELRSIRDGAFALAPIPPILDEISKAKSQLAHSGHPKSLEWYLELSRIQEALAEKQTLTDFTQSFTTNLGRLRAAIVTNDHMRIKSFLDRYAKENSHLGERLSQVLELGDDISALEELEYKSGVNLSAQTLRSSHEQHAKTLSLASSYFLKALSQKI